MANTVIGKSMFAGVILLTPYYRLFTERLYEAYKYLVPLSAVRPNHVFPCEYEEMPEEYVNKYRPIFEDPRNLLFFTARTAKIWVEEQQAARNNIEECPQPMCFIAASKDGVVRNDYIEEYSRLSQSSDSEYHEITGADHTDVCFDEHYCSHLIRASQYFIRKVIQKRAN